MRVHIKVSDTGWILEKMASEIARRLKYVGYGLDEDPAADIQYYVTYSCRTRRVSRVEIAYFTHLENEQNARAKFFEVASSIEHCVCMSASYAEVLRTAGCAQQSKIPPGVDLDTFAPVVRIGVVGRTYHTGRKGEQLVAQMMDIPGIEWYFTGQGWPGVARHLRPEDLPGFYRSLDYVLVSSLVEGGPMCVIEALACGVEVIAPPIGWVPEFPHLEYRTGDAFDLRRVLMQVVDEKQNLRRNVLDRTWENFGHAHDRLFRRLADAYRIKL